MSVALLLGLSLLGATPGEVVVLRSSDLAPYKAVEASFARALGTPTRSLTVTDADAKGACAGAAVVLAIGQDAARAALEARPTGQLLLSLVPAPEKLGAVEGYRLVPMFVAPQRQLAVFKELAPSATRLGVIHGASSSALVAEYERAARSAGLSLVKQAVADSSQVANALRALVGKIDALVLLPDPATLGVDTFKFLLTTSLESKVPLLGFSRGQARAGALMALEADYDEMGREAATAARRALAGGTPDPQAPLGSLYVNGKTAQVLGLPTGAVKDQTKEVF
ncbi:MAG: hypothetical protein IAE78_27935 [Myxococcus sp.]|nr:hypothetical protein [Myxococcus sp.]